MSEFWIGDRVKLIATGQIGTYNGQKSGKHYIISDQGQEYEVELSQIMIWSESKVNHKLEQLINNNPQEEPPSAKAVKTIDLHIEVLNPDLEKALPGRIFEYQIQSFKMFIDQAVAHGLQIVEVIHGKGQGILRKEIKELLRYDKRIHFVFDKHKEGAVEIWLKH